jgi:hypothetical protein
MTEELWHPSLAPLSKIQSSSSTSISTLSISSMDVHVAEEDGGTSTENKAFKESHGGFATAMKAVEEADGGEVASECSDMSDTSDCGFVPGKTGSSSELVVWLGAK